MLKTCTKCGEEKDISEFHSHCRRKDGHREECKECVKKYEYNRYHNGGRKEQQYLARDFLNWIATTIGCADCDDHFYDNPECLSFDHLRDKVFTIGSWVGYKMSSSLEVQAKVMRRLQDELKKCEVVCLNCHGIRTKRDWKRNNQRYYE